MLALAAAFRQKGLKVATFKCGPDYLDPSYHSNVTGRPCHNLDTWMMGSRTVQEVFARHAAEADIALIEGVMGLFDGASPQSDQGSAAEIAKLLDAPVLMVWDVSGMARTFAALAQGIGSFDTDVRIGGHIANRIGSKHHLDLLRQALPQGLLGALPKRPDLAFPERHLGLVTAQNGGLDPQLVSTWVELAEEYLALDDILALARSAPALVRPVLEPRRPDLALSCRIGVAYDAAFHFYYAENLRLLEEAGAQIVLFSPLHDQTLPLDLDALYLGGGYPELYAESLALNEEMFAAIRAFAASGRPVYGECGGLMYLGASLRTLEGKEVPMLGLLPLRTRMESRLQALGYAEVETQETSLLGPAGTRFRGHQFRYSQLESEPEVQHLYRFRKRRGGEVIREGYARESVLGSYVHAHWASHPEIARHFVKAAYRARMALGLPSQ